MEGAKRRFEFCFAPLKLSPDWSTDGQALVCINTRGGVWNIWGQSLDGDPPDQLTDFKSERIFWFDWSRDGKALACARGVVTNDVVMITDLK